MVQVSLDELYLRLQCCEGGLLGMADVVSCLLGGNTAFSHLEAFLQSMLDFATAQQRVLF